MRRIDDLPEDMVIMALSLVGRVAVVAQCAAVNRRWRARARHKGLLVWSSLVVDAAVVAHLDAPHLKPVGMRQRLQDGVDAT